MQGQRIEIDQARLLVLRAAWLMDRAGTRAARVDVSAIKFVAARLQTRVLDRAIQVFGAAGLTEDTPLAYLWTWGRALRFIDGPDEVHLRTVARAEMKKARRRQVLDREKLHVESFQCPARRLCRLCPHPTLSRIRGALAGVRPDELGAHAIRALLERMGIPSEDVEDVIWGCAFPEAEQGLNIGRVVGLLAGLPQSSAGATVNRWCGSSIQAVQVAGGMIAMGAGEAFVAGGTESMSRVPMMGFNIMPPTSWSPEEVLDFVNVGLTAERVAEIFGLSRKDQEQFAYKSQQKATRAQTAGRLAAEIAPIQVKNTLVALDG